MTRTQRARQQAHRRRLRRQVRRRARARAMLVGLVAVVGVAGASTIAPVLEAGEPDQADLAAVSTGEPAQPVQADPPETDDEIVATPATYDLYLSRDPFEAVIEEPETGGGATSSADGQADSDVPSFSSGDDDENSDDVNGDAGSENGGSDGADGACQGGPAELVCDGQVVTLTGLEPLDGEPAAQIQVDTSVHTVRPGEEFDAGFTLESIGDDEVSITYQGTSYRLAMGGGSK